MFGYRSILVEAPRPDVVRRSPLAAWLAVGVVCFGAFMGQLDASIVTLTFRPIQHEFGAPLAAVQWVSLGYLLALVAMLAPVGRIADAVGRKLLAALLACATSALLLVLSAASGLALPGSVIGFLAAAAVVASAAFAARAGRARFPLIPRALLRSRRVALALCGAMVGYLALFGPLVLMPQALAGTAIGELRVGFVLSALPVGFGAAALGGEALLPSAMSNRQRGVTGSLICAFALVMLIVMPMSPIWIAAMLAMAGLGLGVFVPANNAVVMRSAGAGSASVLGGLVNMARGIGTTLGIALVTLGLHLAGSGPARRPGPALALAVLAVAAVTGALIAAAIRPLASGAGAGGRSGEGGGTETEPTSAFG